MGVGTREAGSDPLRWLQQRGAKALEHPSGGDLLSHLERVAARLEGWGSSAALVTAGRWHAAYGTAGFETPLFALHERHLVAEAIGDEAEALVYRYCSCDRRAAFPQVGRPGVAFRDRFTGAVAAVEEADVRSFAELTVANELDVLAHSEASRQKHGRTLAALFRGWSEVLSPAANAAVASELAWAWAD